MRQPFETTTSTYVITSRFGSSDMKNYKVYQGFNFVSIVERNDKMELPMLLNSFRKLMISFVHVKA